MSHVKIATALILSTFAVGCSHEAFEPADGTPDDASALEEQLASGQAFAITPSQQDAASDGSFVGSGIWLDAPTVFHMFVVEGFGDVELDGDTLVLNELTIQFDGMDHEIPGGARMDKMALVLERPIALTTEIEDGAVLSHADLALRLDWWVTTDTSDVKLASQDIEALPLELVVTRDGDTLHFDAILQEDGRVFALDGMFEAEQLDVTLAATSN